MWSAKVSLGRGNKQEKKGITIVKKRGGNGLEAQRSVALNVEEENGSVIIAKIERKGRHIGSSLSSIIEKKP